MRRSGLAGILLVFAIVLASIGARAQEPAPALPGGAAGGPAPEAIPAARGQGVVVLNGGAGRDDAQAAARAVYASRLRPAKLDEAHARALAGDPVASDASKEVRELAELRAAVSGEDAASRRILASVATQLHVEAILVVRGGTGRAPEPPAPPAQSTWGDADGGSATDGGVTAADAGPPAQAPIQGPLEARLFLASTGEFDAARYGPEPGESGTLAWRATVASLERRFAPEAPAPTGPTGRVKPQDGETRPFYASPWFWGAVAGAVLVGGAFYFATRDTSDQPIHVQMHVPR
jgi:hypothetical protein